jgi:hydrogenase expression/formation protein HypC
MCLAIPSIVVAIDGAAATVEAFGQRREVSLLLLDEPVRVGDYLLVQAGGHAFERVEPQAARESLALMQELIARDGSDVLAW